MVCFVHASVPLSLIGQQAPSAGTVRLQTRTVNGSGTVNLWVQMADAAMTTVNDKIPYKPDATKTATNSVSPKIAQYAIDDTTEAGARAKVEAAFKGGRARVRPV
jgi:hypothetical protein